MNLPAKGYRRPDRQDATGLIVSALGTDGQEAGPFDFGVAPAHGQTRQQLIAAFVVATEPDGRWRSAESIRIGYRTVVAFLRSLDRLGISISSLADFGPEQWWAWRADQESRNRWPGSVNTMRVLLNSVPEIGPLTQRVLLQRTHKPRKRLYDSYSVEEFNAIRRRAGEMMRACEARISANVVALESYRDGSADESILLHGGKRTSRGALLVQLINEGRLRLGRHNARPVAAALGTGDLHPTYALFPTRIELLSIMAVMVCDRGYNLSTLQSLTIPDLASGVGEDEVLVAHLDKPRRGRQRFFTNSFDGAHSRMLRSAFAITEPARECLGRLGYPTNQLLIAGTHMSSTDHPTKIFLTSDFTWGESTRRWDQAADLTASDGSGLLHLQFGRLRLSEQVINRKSSQNSAAVSEDVYRRPDRLTAELHREVILDGQSEAVDHASETMRLKYGPISDLGLPTETAAALSAGALDTAASACLDYTHSPFSQAGDPCTASFLMCLSCSNAVATPKHLPRLLLLRDALDNLASVSPDRFDARYREHRERLEDLLTTSTTEADRKAARDAADDSDQAMIERLLNRSLDT